MKTFVLLALLVAFVHGYPTGLYVDLPGGHWCGVEIAPDPGLFCDVE